MKIEKETDGIKCNISLLICICQSDEYFEFLHVFQKYFYLSHYFCDLCSCVCVSVSVFHMTGFIKLILKGLFDLI